MASFHADIHKKSGEKLRAEVHDYNDPSLTGCYLRVNVGHAAAFTFHSLTRADIRDMAVQLAAIAGGRFEEDGEDGPRAILADVADCVDVAYVLGDDLAAKVKAAAAPRERKTVQQQEAHRQFVELIGKLTGKPTRTSDDRREDWERYGCEDPREPDYSPAPASRAGEL